MDKYIQFYDDILQSKDYIKHATKVVNRKANEAKAILNHALNHYVFLS